MNGSWSQGSAGAVQGAVGTGARLLGEPPLSPPGSGRQTPGPMPALRATEPSAPPTVTPAPPPTVTPPTVQAVPEQRPDAPATLESLLVRFRLVTPDQIEEALEAHRTTGRTVAEIVVERGWVTQDQLTRVLAYVPGAAPTPRPAAVAPAAAPTNSQPPKVEPGPPTVAPAAVSPTPVTPAEPVNARVYVRLMGGDRVEVASLDDLGAAKRRAAELVEELLGADGSWPFMAGRFIRPEAIVSIDVEASPA